MESREDDGIAVNPWSSQQQVIRSVSVNNIAHYLGSRSSIWHLSLIFFHQACTIGVEVIDGSLSGIQSLSGDFQVLHDPVGHDAQRESWTHLNVAHLRWSNIPCEVQGSIMLSFNLHVIWSEGYAGDMLRGIEAVYFIFLLRFSQILGHEGLNIG